MKHPNSRAERLKIKEKKNEKKRQTAEAREARLRRKQLLLQQSKTSFDQEVQDGHPDDYTETGQ